MLRVELLWPHPDPGAADPGGRSFEDFFRDRAQGGHIALPPLPPVQQPDRLGNRQADRPRDVGHATATASLPCLTSDNLWLSEHRRDRHNAGKPAEICDLATP